MSKKFNLQLFADFEAILKDNADKFTEDGESIKESYSKISAKLGELGFDVLLNNKKQAEFIPSSRLGEVVGQRDMFKGKVEEMTKTLATLQAGAGDNQKLKNDLQTLMNSNTDLLKELETTKINTEIMIAAKDAVSPKDLLLFINTDNIKVSAKGEILGVEGEIERLKKEKPYLFKTEQTNRRGGSEPGAGSGGEKMSMNSLIRASMGFK
jgi:hypothetical protein